MIDGFDYLLPVLTNHEKDRHVLAAAIHGAVPVIVTFNLRHFPEASLEPWNVAATHPQDYLLALYSMNSGVVLAKLAEIARDHEQDLQYALIHLGKSVPGFSSRVLQDLGGGFP